MSEKKKNLKYLTWADAIYAYNLLHERGEDFTLVEIRELLGGNKRTAATHMSMISAGGFVQKLGKKPVGNTSRPYTIYRPLKPIPVGISCNRFKEKFIYKVNCELEPIATPLADAPKPKFDTDWELAHWYVNEYVPALEEQNRALWHQLNYGSGSPKDWQKVMDKMRETYDRVKKNRKGIDDDGDNNA